MNGHPQLQILLPVYNEGAGIEAVIREIHGELKDRFMLEFIACEDGSRDNTKDILKKLSEEIPIKLILSDERKGYSRAVIDGFKEVSADLVLALDADGQCLPKDFWKLHEQRGRCDVCIGWRQKRQDSALRKTASKIFKIFYQALFHVPIHDPSCPFLLIHKRVIDTLVQELGVLRQGFWWEFMARVHGHGFKIAEVPVEHRRRLSGKTQVYKIQKMPGIFFSHLAGIIRIKRDLKKLGKS